MVGGAFAGPSFGGLENDYFFGEYTGNALYHVDPNGTRDGFAGSPTLFVDDPGAPVEIVRSDGALYHPPIAIGECIASRRASRHRRTSTATSATRRRSHAAMRRCPEATVALADVLVPGLLDFGVTKAVTLCNPASVNGSTVLESTADQEGFGIKRIPGSPKYVKTNQATGDQFANRNLSLTQESTLLVPSSKVLGSGGAPPFTLTTIDHYKCYRATLAKGSPKFFAPASPTIADQFYPGGQSFTLKPPTRFCDPVAADGSPINEPTQTWCATARALPAGIRFTKTTVSTNHPDFGADGADVLVASAVSGALRARGHQP
jgi:hypothetical protein